MARLSGAPSTLPESQRGGPQPATRGAGGLADQAHPGQAHQQAFRGVAADPGLSLDHRVGHLWRRRQNRDDPQRVVALDPGHPPPRVIMPCRQPGKFDSCRIGALGDRIIPGGKSLPWRAARVSGCRPAADAIAASNASPSHLQSGMKVRRETVGRWGSCRHLVNFSLVGCTASLAPTAYLPANSARFSERRVRTGRRGLIGSCPIASCGFWESIPTYPWKTSRL